MFTTFTLTCLAVFFACLLLRSALVLFRPDGLELDLRLDRMGDAALDRFRALVAGPAYRHLG